MSVNQVIRPITTVRNGYLYIGGCNLPELAAKYGTPLYVIDETTLREICREHREAFKEYPNIKMTYASKALCNLAISRIVEDEGFGFDVVSAGELYTVHKAGVNMDNVIIKFSYMNECNDDIFHEFMRINGVKKIFFIGGHGHNTDELIYLPEYNDSTVLDDTFYWNRHIDVTKLINNTITSYTNLNK